MNLNSQNGNSSNDNSKFSAYKSYCQPASHELSEAEVTSSILKGHDSMMAVLANRGRHLEIVHKLCQSKDAKTGNNFWYGNIKKWRHAKELGILRHKG